MPTFLNVPFYDIISVNKPAPIGSQGDTNTAEMAINLQSRVGRAKSLLQRPRKPRRPNDTQREWRGFLLTAGLAAVNLLAQAAQAGSLTFEAKFPNPPVELPVLSLSAQPAPLDLMKRLVASTATSVPPQLTRLSDTSLLQKSKVKLPQEVVGVVENNHVKAWANLRTGDAEIYPTLATTKPISKMTASSLALRGQEIFNSAQFIAPDDSKFVIDQPNVLEGATFVRDAGGGVHPEKPSMPYYVYVAARRFVSGLPVKGPGSRALLTISSGGAVEGMTRIWKTAKKIYTVRPSLSGQQVQDEIKRQLQLIVKGADAVVDNIGLAYYDGNGAFLQPVYYFTVRVHPEATNKAPPAPGDELLVGYVPFAKALEPLPSLDADGVPLPTTTNWSGPVLTPISVGMYIVRADSASWVKDANAFWNALSSVQSSSFSLSQYLWAQPFEFTSQKDANINSVNLALTEVHGNWWTFSTLWNTVDPVSLWSIPYPGYGPSAKGFLANWILHSCEVVPSPDDTLALGSDWVGPWFTIFGGLRNVVGYRTVMYIDDGAGGVYGTGLAFFAPVVSSWLNEVMSLNDYARHPTSIARGGFIRPMGRPSAISMSGHENDTVFDVSWLPRATNLTAWWIAD